MHNQPCRHAVGWLWLRLGIWLIAGMAAPAAASPSQQPTHTTEVIMRPATQPAPPVAAVPPIDAAAPPIIETASFGLG